MIETKEAISTPVKLSARDKAAVTDETARNIIVSETMAREKKTARLRELRMQQEMAVEAEPAPARKAIKRAPSRKA